MSENTKAFFQSLVAHAAFKDLHLSVAARKGIPEDVAAQRHQEMQTRLKGRLALAEALLNSPKVPRL